MRPTPILTTLVFALRDDHILLMQRRKQPNLGLWVAPGGKLEHNEAPFECAARELQEETGLRADVLIYRGVVTEWSPRPDWQWMMFLYLAPEPLGLVGSDEREGALRWWPVDALPLDAMPEADRVFVPPMLDLTKGPYEARMVYDEALRLVQVVPKA